MALEAVTYIDDLVVTNPTSGDPRSEGDDHIRNMKLALKNCFPGLAGRSWRAQTKTINYTVLSTDNMTFFNIATTGLTLAFTAAATLGNGHMFLVHANGFNVTLDPNGAETINGAATLVVPNGFVAYVYCNGTSFVAVIPQLPVLSTQALTDAATIAWDTALGANATVTLTASRTMGAPTNLKAGGIYVLHVSQNATGGWALTWNAVFKGFGGQAMASVQPIPTLSTTSSFMFISSDGTNLNLIWSRIGNMQVFTANGTYTPTPGMRYCKVTVVGGGAGGGGGAGTGAGSVAAACGGAAGGTAIKIVSAATVGASQTVTIGAKGTGGSNAPTGGANGSTTSFGAIVTASGGSGGAGATAQANNAPCEGGSSSAGGVGASGDINITGGPGSCGFQFATANRVQGGHGGSSTHGGGAAALASNSSGNGGNAASTAYGAGGAGGQVLGATAGGASGGNGCDGVCIVEEYF